MKKLISGAIISAVLFIIISAGHWEYLVNIKIAIIYAIGVVASYYQADYSPFKTRNNDVDKGTVLHIIWTVYITQGLALAEAFYLNFPHSMQMNIAAGIFLAVALFGLWYRSWAYIVLGKFFTMHLETQNNHRVIEDGPYRHIRHPSYTGAFLTYVFIPLFLGSYYSAALSVVLFSWAFARRIEHEESMLERQLGESYKAFCVKRSRLFPGIW